ncbi:DUF4214 domain-containing protein [Thiorhodovibrio frisius]|uniref:DUF4214 domain-containing protein n=1 Tax=Thiorhodovibrio frisius TaxID=631362 RepID=H8Z1T8_9GAMM|nr:DUF4214 domain-containing protein [Thiorhodovibrio frisius]EIC22566.1 hypothetical protein Thi970DRAFT_02837 [Thiorhodovibrio frisius]WPL20007.1 hypothetical protein Thiofri_00058 [Thiorhodovibrio frisius]
MADITTSQAIVGLYTGMYARSPDKEGDDFWLNAAQNQFGAGPTDNVKDLTFMRSIAADFATYPTFAVQYPADMTDDAFVTAIYNNITDRDPDADGLEYWTGRLEGGEARSVMIADFLYGTLTADYDSPAFANLTPEQKAEAQAAQDVANNKVNVGQYYVDTMGDASNYPEYTTEPFWNTDPASPTYVEDAAALQKYLDGLQVYQYAVQSIAAVTEDPATVGTAETLIDGWAGGGGGDVLNLDTLDGTIDMPADVAAVDGQKFTDSVDIASFSDISNFGETNSLEFGGVTADDVSVSVEGGVTTFEFDNGGGIISTIQLVGVDGFFTTVEEFNADPSYGDITFA